MIKREEADSGLRAGFIREDDAKDQINQQPQPKPPVDKKIEAEVKAEVEAIVARSEGKSQPPKIANGPKVSVQGVSGRMITGVIKAVKKKITPHKDKTEVSDLGEKEPSVPDKAEPGQPEKAAPVLSPAVETVTEVPAQSPKTEPSVSVEKSPQAESPKAEVKAKTISSVEDKPVKTKAQAEKLPGKGAAASENKQSAATSEVREEAATAAKTRPVKSAAPQTADVKTAEPAKTLQQDTTVGPEKAKAAAELAPTKKAEAVAQAETREEKTEPVAPPVTGDAPADAAQSREKNEKATQVPDLGDKVPSRSATPSQNRGEKSQEREVRMDPELYKSYMERSGKKPFRPQKGSYLGKDSATPAFKEQRPGSYSSGQGRSFGGSSQSRGRSFGAGSQGGRSFGSGGGRFNKGGFRDNMSGGMGKDKDEEETPRRTRSPKPQKARSFNDAPDLAADKKSESRRSYAAHRQKGDRDRFDLHEFGNSQELDFAEETLRRSRRKARRGELAPQAKTPTAVLTQVKLPEQMTVKELAELLKKTSAEVIKKLMNYGVMATVNQEIDYDTAEVIAGEFEIKAEKIVEIKEEDILFDDSDDKPEDLQERPPVVVVMGHVDHGKTSILDWIRETHVARGEAGGITQHIGAYQVEVKGKKITFLDTPGHEAFTAMRARGAQVTDIAILVVAADDGVMPQTIEAIHHARAAETEIIVAINKIDKPGANIDRVKQELAAQGLLAPEWGGDVTMVPVSAKTGENMEELLETVILTADILELKANPNRQAKGTVIEARLDKNRGAIATVLVQRGTLHTGHTLVVGTLIGNIRAMMNEHGEPITEAGPSVPVEILGLPDVPEDGDIFYEVENERVARSLVERRRDEERARQLRKNSKVSLDNIFEQMSEGETKELNIIIKADVQGSVEAVTQSLEKLSNDEVKLKVIHGAVGAITESDVRLADVSDAIIIGFNVRPAANVKDMAKDANVDIRLYRVIYDAIEDMQAALTGMLAPTIEEEILGHAEVRETYKVSSVGTIAGCYVTDGKIQRNAKLRLVRDGIVIHEGNISSLKRFKDDAREVAQGYECGVGIERYNDIKPGDIIEMYRMNEVART